MFFNVLKCFESFSTNNHLWQVNIQKHQSLQCQVCLASQPALFTKAKKKKTLGVIEWRVGKKKTETFLCSYKTIVLFLLFLFLVLFVKQFSFITFLSSFSFDIIHQSLFHSLYIFLIPLPVSKTKPKKNNKLYSLNANRLEPVRIPQFLCVAIAPPTM